VDSLIIFYEREQFTGDQVPKRKVQFASVIAIIIITITITSCFVISSAWRMVGHSSKPLFGDDGFHFVYGIGKYISKACIKSHLITVPIRHAALEKL
jgi:hypothetical protein